MIKGEEYTYSACPWIVFRTTLSELGLFWIWQFLVSCESRVQCSSKFLWAQINEIKNIGLFVLLVILYGMYVKIYL